MRRLAIGLLTAVLIGLPLFGEADGGGIPDVMAGAGVGREDGTVVGAIEARGPGSLGNSPVAQQPGRRGGEGVAVSALPGTRGATGNTGTKGGGNAPATSAVTGPAANPACDFTLENPWVGDCKPLPMKGAPMGGGSAETAPGEPATPPPPPPTHEEVESWVESAAVEMQLPLPTPHIGPDPNMNRWNSAAVGYPLWLWTTGPTTLSTSVSVQDATLVITATRGATTWSMGDGTTKTCTTMTPWSPSIEPGQPSPTCGHVYTLEPAHEHATITATTTWQVQWEGAGFSGTFAVQRSAQRRLPVSEFEAVVTDINGTGLR